MSDTTKTYPEARGGCQCGAVRFVISAGPAKPGLCHCRMCQRATGNAFAPLYEVESDRITWTGTARDWASSNIAWRGFCGVCGTPLYYRSGNTTEIMAGCMTPDSVFDPVAEGGQESRVAWLDHLPDLPSYPTQDALIAKVVSHQSPEEA